MKDLQTLRALAPLSILLSFYVTKTGMRECIDVATLTVDSSMTAWGKKTNKRVSGEGNNLFQKIKTLFAATLLNAYILQLSHTEHN